MTDNDIKVFLNNIDVAVTVYPEEKAGMVLFSPLEHYESTDGLISFSALVIIEYNGVLKHKLSLQLVRLAADDDNALQTFSLEKIFFDKNHAFYCNNKKVDCGNSFKSCSIDVKPFDHRHCLRYSFNGIPLCGSGMYYLSLGLDIDNSFLPIKSAPIMVEIVGEN